MKSVRSLALLAVCASISAEALRAENLSHRPDQQDFVHGSPDRPSKSWMLAAGGRIYDNWWDALDRKKPDGTNPSYPSTGKRQGATTWRCVECHGWDYKGKDGLFSSGERYTGVMGIRGARSMSVAQITKMMRRAPHNYTPEMIRDDELGRLALFVREGQHDADLHIDRKTAKAKGDAARGAAVFQTVCAACHGFDGRLLNWGTKDEPAFVGTEARKFPAEVLHKIRNSHPGAAMVSLRAFPLADAVDVLAYAQSLPEK
jgi:thiosulfate dehydrogenase